MDSQPRRQHLSSSEKTAPKRQKGKSGYTQVCNKGIRQSEQRPGITEFTPFICTSAIWNQSCFLVHFVSYSSCLLKTQEIFSFHTFRVQLSAIPQSMEFSRPEYWWVAFPFSRESSQPRDGTLVSRITGRFFTS